MSPIGYPRSGQRSRSSQSETNSRLFVLLVGVDTYQDERLVENLGNLWCPAANCQALEEALRNCTQHFKAVNIVNLGKANHPVKLSDFLASFQFFNTTEPDDILLVYFSGHGVLDGRVDPPTPILCLSDTEWDRLSTTGLPVGTLLDEMANCPARRKIIWLESCCSGSTTYNPTTQVHQLLSDWNRERQGFYAFLSCDAHEDSYELRGAETSLFAHFLVRGLEGEAADEHGNIEFFRLYEYLAIHLERYVRDLEHQLQCINAIRRREQESNNADIVEIQPCPPQNIRHITSGQGQLIIGRVGAVRPTSWRKGLIVDGMAVSELAIALAQRLHTTQGFDLRYEHQPHCSTQELVTLVHSYLEPLASNPQLDSFRRPSTSLLYLRGRINGDYLEMGEVQLSSITLRQLLASATTSQQVIILDCPQAVKLEEWVNGLLLGDDRHQCVVWAASETENPNHFLETVIQALEAADPTVGLTATAFLTELENRIGMPSSVNYWLTGSTEVIEVLLPRRNVSQLSLPPLDPKICPYMGLKAFTQDDAVFFSGRQELIDEILGMLETNPFFALVGPSGSGKSSLIQAGVLPAMTGRGYIARIARLSRPEDSPFQALAISLGGDSEPTQQASLATILGVDTLSDSNRQIDRAEDQPRVDPAEFVRWLRGSFESPVVLVIDQIEKLFFPESEIYRQSFLDFLLGVVNQAGDYLKIIIALRSDFLTPFSEDNELTGLYNRANMMLSPSPSLVEYRQMINIPARRFGLAVEPGLMQVLFEQFRRAEIHLPLLEFVLRELWEYRQGVTLTLDAYARQVGGLRGALGREADRFFKTTLAPELQDCARWIFLSLTHVSRDSKQYTQRFLSEEEFVTLSYDINIVRRTLRLLVDHRLIICRLYEQMIGGEVAGKWKYETVHETLVTEWSFLNEILEARRPDLIQQRDIEKLAKKWDDSQSEEHLLLDGKSLNVAEKLYFDKYPKELTATIGDFLRKSRRKNLKKRLVFASVVTSIVSIPLISVSLLGLFTGFAVRCDDTRETRKGFLKICHDLISTGDFIHIEDNSADNNLLKAIQSFRTGMTNIGGKTDLAKSNLFDACERYEELYRDLEETNQVFAAELSVYANNSCRLHESIVNSAIQIHKVSLVLPLTERRGQAGKLLIGTATALREFNTRAEQERSKVRLVLSLADDDNNINRSKDIANQLSRDKEMRGVIGHSSSEICLEVSKVYAKRNIAMVTPTCTSVYLKDCESCFRVSPPDDETAKVLADFLKSKDLKSIGIYRTEDDAYSESIGEELENSFDCRLDEVKCNLLGDELSNEDLKKLKLQAVALFPSVNNVREALTLAKRVREISPKIYIIGGDTLDIGIIKRELDKNVFIVLPPHRDWRLSTSEISILALGEAIKALSESEDSKSISRSSVIDYLHGKVNIAGKKFQLELAEPGIFFRFDEDGDPLLASQSNEPKVIQPLLHQLCNKEFISVDEAREQCHDNVEAQEDENAVESTDGELTAEQSPEPPSYDPR